MSANSIEHSPSSHSKALKIAGRSLLCLALALGLFARFADLGERPLAEDEYYWAMGIGFIVEHGLPAFPTGGYYPRALPFQYASAALSATLGHTEAILRFPATLFGLLTIPMVYLYARNFARPSIALAAAAVFALSAWEIEFSRFARMYTVFQFLTVLFLHLSHRAFLDGQLRWRYLPHIILFLTIVIHQQGVLLIPLLFAPVIFRPSGAPIDRRLLAANLIVSIVSVGYMMLENRAWRLGLAPALPDYFPPLVGETVLLYPLHPALATLNGIVAAVAALIGIAGLIIGFRNRWDFEKMAVPLGLASIAVFGLFHLFTPLLIVLVGLMLRYHLHRLILADQKLAIALVLSLAPAGAWLLWIAVDPQRLQTVSPGDPIRAFRLIFFALPDIYTTGLGLWYKTVFKLSILVWAACAFCIIARSKRSLLELCFSPAAFPIYLLLALGTIESNALPTTRYWFIAYPSMMVAVAYSFEIIARWIEERRLATPLIASVATVAAFGIAFLATEDFQIKQILRPAADDVTYRTGAYARFDNHWYHRFDERSIAHRINDNPAPADAVVVTGRISAIDFYLEPSRPYAYFLSSSEMPKRFDYRSRDRGERELWTGWPLLDTNDELIDYTRPAASVDIVRMAGPRLHDFDPEAIWGERLSSLELVATSADGRIELLRATLNPKL